MLPVADRRVLTFGIFLCWRYGASRWGRDRRVHAGWGTEVFDDLGVGAWRASSTLLKQLGYIRGSITLDQRVLFPLDGLHQRPDQWVQFVREHLQVNHGTGCAHVHTQMQLLPFGAGLHHSRLSLLAFTVQCLPLFGLHIQAWGGFCKDGGYLGNKHREG